MNRTELAMLIHFYDQLHVECDEHVGDHFRVTKIADRLIVLAKRANRYNERRSSDETWNSDDDSPDERRADKVDQEIVKLAKELGVEAIIGGDPRGYPALLKMPSGNTAGDTFGGRGMAIPLKTTR